MAARYFFNSPTDWANALVAYLLCAVIFLAMPGRRAAAPIAITIFVDRAAPARRHLWRALLATISAATCFAVFWISASATWVQFRDGVLTVATCKIPSGGYRSSSPTDCSVVRCISCAKRSTPIRPRRRSSRNDMVDPHRGRRAPLLLLLFVAGIPAFVCFLILNLIGLLALTGTAGFGMFANSIFTTATNGTLAAVPLFILMGEIMFRSGAMKTLFDALDRLVGQIRGRQFVLCILLSAILGALSGAAMAVAGLLGRSLFPTMVQRGYDRRLSAGTIMAGACLDPIIPECSRGHYRDDRQRLPASMLVAGILPGLLLMGMFLIYVVGRVWLDPSLAPDSQVDIADRNKEGTKTAAVLRMVPCVFVFFMVMGLIMLGVATPTEAAATGVFGALVVSIYYGGLSKQMI